MTVTVRDVDKNLGVSDELDQEPPADVLDPSTRRQIRVALEHLGCRDLYDALQVTRDAPVTYVVARADAERQRWMKKAHARGQAGWEDIRPRLVSWAGHARQANSTRLLERLSREWAFLGGSAKGG